MPNSIKKLSKEISMLIAAGEVIERPVSVIKELVENSIDADSRIIIIEIEKGGFDSISVSDNGGGINSAEIKLAFERHATSKIENKEDIHEVKSLGFRGEALSAINSVSEVECISREKNSKDATKISFSFGKFIKHETVGSNYGTKIFVRNLFKNMPARYKFLSSEKSEKSKIIQFFNEISLTHTNISFELIIDGRRKYKTDGNNSIISIMDTIYNLKQNGFIKLYEQNDNFEINGILSNPNNCFGNRSRMKVSINGRVVKNSSIYFTIENSYKPFIEHRRFPIISVDIKIPHKIVDVNVHPQKYEVKFLSEHNLLSFIYTSISKILNNNVPPKSIPIKTNQETIYQNYTDLVHEQMSFGNEESLSLKKTLPILRFVGQIKQLFIVCEGPDGIYLVDQHAAHERILFEQFQKQKNEKAFQMLTINNYYDLGVTSNNKIIENIEKFHELGWDIDASPSGGIIVRNIPYQKLYKTKSTDIAELLQMISSDLEKKQTDTPKEIISKRLACHNAVRAGQKLSENESKKLLIDLENTEVPWDPHGRPAVIKIKYDYLLKEFGR